jgi:hypothetical protein
LMCRIALVFKFCQKDHCKMQVFRFLLY